MSDYQPYPAYKDSGLEWIRQVPEHWGVKPIKIVASCNDDSLSEMESADTVIRYVDISAVSYHEGISKTETMLFGNAPSRARRKAKAGDVIISTVRTYLKAVASVDDDHSDCIYSTGFAVLRARNGQMEPRFMKWLVLNELFIQSVEAHSKGVSYPAINAPELVNLKVVIPSLSEQKNIAARLDSETSRIDTLIDKKKRFIELLKEKRSAIIAHAVLKGLDPNVKMKDSKVKWIGEIPDHWHVSKLGYVASEYGGKTPSTDNKEYWNGDIPWVSPKDMKTSLISDSIDHISLLAVDECGMSTIPENAVLVVVRGMILAHSFPVAETVKPVTINQDMKALVPHKGVLSSYLRLVLESAKTYVVSVLVAEAAHGTRVLRTDIWKQLPVVLPRQAEQQQIVEHVSSISEKYERLLFQTERSIDLLKEHRSALITAAVTGQVDLRRSV